MMKMRNNRKQREKKGWHHKMLHFRKPGREEEIMRSEYLLRLESWDWRVHKHISDHNLNIYLELSAHPKVGESIQSGTVSSWTRLTRSPFDPNTYTKRCFLWYHNSIKPPSLLVINVLHEMVCLPETPATTTANESHPSAFNLSSKVILMIALMTRPT